MYRQKPKRQLSKMVKRSWRKFGGSVARERHLQNLYGLLLLQHRLCVTTRHRSYVERAASSRENVTARRIRSKVLRPDLKVFRLIGSKLFSYSESQYRFPKVRAFPLSWYIPSDLNSLTILDTVVKGTFHCRKSADNSRELDVELHYRLHVLDSEGNIEKPKDGKTEVPLIVQTFKVR